MTLSLEKILAAGKREAQRQQKKSLREQKFTEFMEWAQRIFGDQIPFFIPSVVKVDYEKGIRKPLTKWSKVDRSLMHEYGWKQRMIDALTEEKDDGCIQVKLGPQSFHLCVLDVDADELVELVLEAMPVLGETLQTRGSKGRHFWFYLVGDYPKHKKQIICQGFTIEFLTEHSLCTIHGTHYKTGEPYQVINEATPITLKFEDIKPPADGEWKAKASNNGAGTKFSRSHMHGTASKHGGYDWKSYDAAIAAQDGLVDILVDEYFGDAIRIDGVWRCGDITGRTGRGRGSFVIEPNGRCTEYDDDSSCSIMQAITSDERDEKNTYEDVFAFIEKEAGLNLFMPPANKEVVLPQKGQKLKGEFATDVANVLQNDEFWFTTAAKIVTRIDRSIETWVNDEGVEVEGRERLRLVAVSASEAESTLEEKVNTGVVSWTEIDGKKVRIFQKHSIDNWTARMLLKAPKLIDNLPKIDRVLDVTIPISSGKNTWILPQPGYNRDLRLLLDTDIQLQEMPLSEAKKLLAEIVADFPFDDEQSRTNWYARLVTPMCRGIMGFNHRVPLFTFMGNRPRAGKDYLNGVAQTLFYGSPFEDPSISATSSEETRKRLTTALSAGRRSMHIANQQAFLDDAVFIGAITAPIIHDRRLGSNDAEAQLEFRNELEFTMSGNVGLQWREDLTPRMRIINLSYYEEDANSRTFRYPDLHGYIRNNRTQILSALYTLILHWQKKGCPVGGIFTSFPRWARIVGGVVATAELGDATEVTRTTAVMGGDPREEAIRGLYEAAYKKFPEEWMTTVAFESAFGSGLGVLSDVTDFWSGLHEKSDKARFAKDMEIYNRRWLSGIRMILEAGAKKKKFIRDRIIFTRDEKR